MGRIRLGAQMVGRAEPPLLPGEADDPVEGARRAPEIAPRIAFFVLRVVFGGFCLNAFIYVLAARLDVVHTVSAALCLVVLLWLQLRFISNPRSDPRSPASRAAFALQALLVIVPIAFYGQAWMGMPGFLAGSALLVLRPPAGWITAAAVVVGAGLIQRELTGPPLDVAYFMVVTALTGLIVYGLSRLRSLVLELHAAHSALAGLAVTRERLRFARDLHDLLGFSLSAITLKAELTLRLLAGQPQRAEQELSELLTVSRQALSDVRSVASSYRELSLGDEIESARSVMVAAEVDVTMRLDHGDPPPEVSTALATVLREGVTNLLRHSKAEHCTVTISRESDAVRIDIVNDGVPAEPAHEADESGGSGIRNLTTRVEALGGTLTAEVEADSHRLHARIPLRPQRPRTESDESAGQSERGQGMATRRAQLIVTGVFAGYAVNGVLQALDAGLGVVGTLVATACVAASLALQLSFFTRPHVHARSSTGYAALAAQAVFTYLPIVLFDQPTLGLPGFLAGTALLVLRPPAGWIAFVAVVASMGAIQALAGSDLTGIGYGIVATTNAGLVVYGMSRLRALVTGLHAIRSELATLAVTRERLRFARDLHDLLGFSLSSITLKSELAHRLLARDPERAEQELAEVLTISRQALADVRSVATSYRELSLDDEIAAARSVLAAADVAVTVRAEHGELPRQVRTVLATVLREGVTNLLRHRRAEHCDITIRRTGEQVVIDIVNDGAPSAPAPDGAGLDHGSGIRNLSSRVEDLGGHLTAGTTSEDTFRLHAEIPLR